MPINHTYDVLIIGAGPVGLATALGLYQRGIDNILVLDQTHSFRQAGQTVDLLPNGLKALKCISNEAYEQIKLTSYTFSKPSTQQVWHRKNLAGKITYTTSLDFYDWQQQYGEGRVSTPWYHIQTYLRELLPPEIIKTNHRCSNIQIKKDLVYVDFIAQELVPQNPFAHWDNPQCVKVNKLDSQNRNYEQIRHQFHAPLVIAADGINSTIRQILYSHSDLQAWAKPQYSGYSAIGCFAVENVSDQIVQQLEHQYLQGERIVTVTPEVQKDQESPPPSPRIIIIKKEKNSFGYLLHLPIAREKLLNSSAAATINLAQKALSLAGYPPVFSQLIGFSNPEQLITRPYYLHPADLPVEQDYIWTFERVALVGDAAHGMPPFMAQGTNQGFEDALFIVKLITKLIQNNELTNGEKVTNLLQEYERKRRPFMTKIQSATMNSYRWTKTEWDQYSQAVYSRNFSSQI